MRFGIEGYGLYFACVEMIAEKLSSENMSFELEHDAELISHKFKIDSKRTEQIMKYCIALNLFQYNEESNKILCLALSRRVDNTTAQEPQFKALLENIRTKKLEVTLSNFKLLKETCSILEQSIVNKNIEEDTPHSSTPVDNSPKRAAKKLAPEKQAYAEGVTMTPEQHAALIAKYGADAVSRAIEKLSTYKLSNGKQYKSDYHALLQWVFEAIKAEPRVKASAAPKGWECPHCKARNNHTGSRCLACRKDRDDPVENEPF